MTNTNTPAKDYKCAGCRIEYETYAMWNFVRGVQRLCSKCKQKGYVFTVDGVCLDGKGRVVRREVEV